VTERLVLLVDDEDDIRLVAKACLERLGGWRVQSACSGLDALEHVRAERPDAIVLDVMMPGLDGPATLARLRADPDTAEIPVLFLTAKAQASDRAELESLGVQAVLTKPFDPMTLADQIRAALGWS
jgi:CheY-like chemotaxis protein